MKLPVSQQGVPKGFKRVSYEHRWPVTVDTERMWAWLNAVETFRDGQVGPFVVEFIDPKSPDKPQFRTGVQTNHYGLFLNAAGVIGEIRHLEYRDLQYYYGSYVFSFALVRPTRLQFFFNRQKNELKMQLDAFVRPWFERVWLWGMGVFWPRFGVWLSKENKGAAAATDQSRNSLGRHPRTLWSRVTAIRLR